MGYPNLLDLDDMPTDQLLTLRDRCVDEIITSREVLVASGQCPYCKTNVNNPAHGCRYADDPSAFHQSATPPDPFRRTRPLGRKSILREWVEDLPVRAQGTLLTAVRGYDLSPKDDPCKLFARIYRGVILYTNDENPASFVLFPNWDGTPLYVSGGGHTHGSTTVPWLINQIVGSHDHYVLHYMNHLLHACEIVGYKHPHEVVRKTFHDFYVKMVDKYHMGPESEQKLDARLTADEKTFAANQ